MAIFSHTTGYATEHRKRTRKRLRTKHGRSHTRARVSRRVRIKRPKMRAPSPRWARAAHLRRRRRHAVSRVRTCATGHAAALHGARCGCGANARRLPLHGTRHAEHHADHVTCALRCILHVGQGCAQTDAHGGSSPHPSSTCTCHPRELCASGHPQGAGTVAAGARVGMVDLTCSITVLLSLRAKVHLPPRARVVSHLHLDADMEHGHVHVCNASHQRQGMQGRRRVYLWGGLQRLLDSFWPFSGSDPLRRSH